MRHAAASSRSSVRPSRSAPRALAGPQCAAAAAQHATLLLRRAEAPNAAPTTLGATNTLQRAPRRTTAASHAAAQSATAAACERRPPPSPSVPIGSAAVAEHDMGGSPGAGGGRSPLQRGCKARGAQHDARSHAVQREQVPESGSAWPHGRGWPGKRERPSAARRGRRYSSFARARLHSPAAQRERARCVAACRCRPPPPRLRERARASAPPRRRYGRKGRKQGRGQGGCCCRRRCQGLLAGAAQRLAACSACAFLRARCAVRPAARAERRVPPAQAECEKHTTHNDCWLILHGKARAAASRAQSAPCHVSSVLARSSRPARPHAPAPARRCITSRSTSTSTPAAAR